MTAMTSSGRGAGRGPGRAGRVRRLPQATGTVLAAALCSLLLGCGPDTATDAGPPAAEETQPFDVATATLTDQPFCDRVDPSLVGSALGMRADRVQLRTERAVGDKFQGPDEEAPWLRSDSNMCVFGSRTRQFLVAVAPDSTEEAAQEAIDYYTRLAADATASERCRVDPDESFGDPAVTARCESTGDLHRAMAAATGLVGSSRFFCSATVNTGAGPDFASTALEACRSTLEDVSSAVEADSGDSS